MNNEPNQHNIPCTATTSQGNPCRAWAVGGTDPPRCVAHGGGSGKHGAPKGNKNAVKHGFYADGWSRNQSMDIPEPKTYPENQDPDSSIHSVQTAMGDTQCLPRQSQDQMEIGNRIDLEQTIINIIQDLYNKHITLSVYIDQHSAEMSLPEYSHLLALHAQMASRLGRLLRDLVAVSPETSDWLDEVMRQAYEGISDNLGVNLTADKNYIPKTGNQT